MWGNRDVRLTGVGASQLYRSALLFSNGVCPTWCVINISLDSWIELQWTKQFISSTNNQANIDSLPRC